MHARTIGSEHIAHQLSGCKAKKVVKKNKKEADKVMREIDALHTPSGRLSPWDASKLPLANTSATGIRPVNPDPNMVVITAEELARNSHIKFSPCRDAKVSSSSSDGGAGGSKSRNGRRKK